MTDDRMFEAIDDLIGFLEAGINVVSQRPGHPPLPEPDTARSSSGSGSRMRARRADASLHVNGIDPGWANDIFPLQLTSLSQRIDQVRVMEIADYSTYDQPVMMRDIFGFGNRSSEVMLWQPGIISMAWGPVVRQMAAGLDLTLDEPLVEIVDRLPADHDISTVSVDIRRRHDGGRTVRDHRHGRWRPARRARARDSYAS